MSLGGSANTANMPFVLVGDAIFEHTQWCQSGVWFSYAVYDMDCWTIA